MRRFITSLVLVAIWAQMALPFVSTTAQELPACCRRLGKHHCANQGSNDTSGPAAPAANGKTERCPLFPGSVSPAPGLKIAVVPSAHISAPTADSITGVARISDDAASTPDSDLAQKRGPPQA